MQQILLIGNIFQEPVLRESERLSRDALGKKYWEYKVECENDLEVNDRDERIHVIYSVINFDAEKRYDYSKSDEVTVTGKFVARLYKDKNNTTHMKLFVFETYEMCFDNNSASIIIDEICNR